MPHCPKCQSTNLRRSPTRNRWERWRKEITGNRPYRCRKCQWRGWLQAGIVEHTATASASRPAPPEPPNLQGTMLARPDPRLNMDLKVLDEFHRRAKDHD